ncbi:MAG: SPOR domain-containing protein [Nitrosomonas sp.]|nr:MAG: SPOR domain-containing protein [Nitrosomonas sp.]
MSRDYKTRKPNASKPEKGGSAFFGGFVGYALGLVSAIAIWLYLNFGQTPFLSSEKVTRAVEKNQPQPAPEAASKTAKVVETEEAPQVIEEKPRFDFYKILPGIDEPEIEYRAQRETVVPEPPKPVQATAKTPEVASKPVAVMPAAPVSVAPPPVVPVETAAVHSRPVAADPKPLANSQQQQQPPQPPQPPVQHSAIPQAVSPAPAVKEKIFLQAGAFRRTDDAEKMKAQLALLGVFAAIQSIDLADKGTLYRVRIGPFNSKADSDRTSASLKENGIETQLVKIQ